MRAIRYSAYGSPDNLALVETAPPVPKRNEVLIRVHAASVNSWDWDLLTGTPQGRLMGPFKPPHPVLGADVAGRVEAVGPDVTRFRPGDAVFGDISQCGWGGFADYVCAPETVLVLKPDAMSFEAAAAIPQAGLLALQAVRKGDFSVPGRRVLINGAGGGMGSFAIQMARNAGAEVTGVDHASKRDFMHGLGADHVLDCESVDFTRAGGRYDLIVDAVANRSVFAYARCLAPGGVFVMVGGTVGALLQTALLGPLLSLSGSRRLGILMWRPSTDDLEEMKTLFAAGDVVPVIDSVYPLEETAAALRHIGEKRAKGKIVVTTGA